MRGRLAPEGAPVIYLADISEYQSEINDAAYLAWSKAIAIRALYGTGHVDGAWYGGGRRAALHAGGVQWLGLYQFLVAGQSGAAQAQAFHQLVGPIQVGEVFIADFEQGDRAMLTAWYDTMLSLYGAGIGPYLWTYTNLNFGQAQGVLPVEWIADYSSTEPSTPHVLWQFTDAHKIPGVGVCDCNAFDGTVTELASYAYQGQPPPRPTVAQWTCEGLLSLADLASFQLHSDVAMLLWLTAENSPHSLYTVAMANYLNEVFAADTVKVPAGIILWHPDISTVTPFASHGDQTLLGLALGWGCECAEIVRLTAENSPGAVFNAGMASYLDGVFARSALKVPAGTVIFYLKG